MIPLKFDRIYDAQMAGMIHDLSKEASKVKAMIFKSNLMNSEIDKYNIQHYISYINDFIAAWDEYSKNLSEKMKSTKGSKGVRSIEYEDVKDYVYAKYDYASVLWFASRVITGIKENKFNKAEDIEDFFEDTISKAFDGQPSSVAGLLDSVTSTNLNTESVAGPLEAKMFDSVARYNKLFDTRNRAELYKAAKATVEFLASELSMKDKITVSNAGLFAAMVNHIIEYITYSVTAFATRIYIISVYAYPFIRNQNPIFKESVDPEELSHSDSVEVTIMNNMDESDCRNYLKFSEFIDNFKEFLRLIGTEMPMEDKTNTWDRDIDRDNAFYSKLVDNPLNEFLTNPVFRERLWAPGSSSMNRYAEINQLLKTFIYNGNQGIETSSSPKQAILHVIRGIDCKTLKGYQELSKDLYEYSKCILTHILNVKKNMEDEINYSVDGKSAYKLSDMNSMRESVRMLDELYRELTFAVLQKARDIEFNINKLKGTHLKDVLGNISVKVPGGNKELDITTNNSSLAVPDSMRIPSTLADMYSMPAFEGMQMFDEYLRTISEFSDDMYLSEAFNISQAFNKFLAMMKGFLNRAKSFYENTQLHLTIQWVSKHKSELTSMDFSEVSMKILPYKDKIGLPEGFDNFEKGLDKFDPTQFTSEQAIDNYIKTLYPNPKVYEWFTKESGPRMYKNYILYQEINNVTDKAPELIEIKGNKIREYLNDWIATMETAMKTYEGIKKISDSYIAKVEEIGKKTVNATSSSSNNSSTPTTGGSDGNKTPDQPSSSQKPSGDDKAKSDDKQPASDQEQAENKGKPSNAQGGDLINKAINNVEIASSRLWGTLVSTFIEYTRTQYKYIKEAYSLGRKR